MSEVKIKIEVGIDEFIGRQVKQTRLKKSVNQDELAGIMNISTMGLSLLEHGERRWKVHQLVRVARYLGVNFKLDV